MPASAPVRNLAWFAAACFVAGWFLPATADVPGWQAFRYAFAPLWPYGSGGAQDFDDAAPRVLSALTNLAFVVMLALLFTDRLKRPGLFLRAAIACFVLNLYWPVQLIRHGSLGDLWIGYYVWLAAFALLIVIGGLLARSRAGP